MKITLSTDYLGIKTKTNGCNVITGVFARKSRPTFARLPNALRDHSLCVSCARPRARQRRMSCCAQTRKLTTRSDVGVPTKQARLKLMVPTVASLAADKQSAAAFGITVGIFQDMDHHEQF